MDNGFWLIHRIIVPKTRCFLAMYMVYIIHLTMERNYMSREKIKRNKNE
jgi:hypothetical protein